MIRSTRNARSTASPFAAAALAFALAAGCAPSDAAEGLAEGDTALDVGATELFRVGVLEGEEWETFARVDRVRFDGAGNLYILDRDRHQVVVVDPEGNHLRTVGSRGEGPGQLRIPMTMEVQDDGTVIVGDVGARAYVIYGPDGAYLRMVSLSPDDGFPSPSSLLHPEGMVSWGASIAFRGGPGARPEIPPGVPVRLTALDGAGTRTITELWAPPRDLNIAGNISVGSGGAVRMIRGAGGGPALRGFEPRPHVAVLPDGRVAFADSTDYRIRIVHPSGDDAGSASRAIVPRPVGEEERRLERERRLDDLESGAAPAPTIVVMGGGGAAGGGGAMSMGGDDWEASQRERIAAMEFADEIPVIQQMVADRDGRLWVERAALPGEEGPVDLLDPSGGYLGTIPPAGVRIPAAFGPGGVAAYIERDDFDVPSIRVVRLSGLP